MLKFRRETYDLLEPTEVSLFDNPHKFLTHVQDHFINPSEHWMELLGGRKFLKQLKSVLGDSFLRDPCQKWQDREVSMVKEVYDTVCSVLHDGMQFSSELPLFIVYSGQRTNQKTGHVSSEEGYYCLAQWGCVMIVRKNVLRSAYFHRIHPGDSNTVHFSKVFREAWSHLRDKFFGTQGWFDGKSESQIHLEEVRFESAGNWMFCPSTQAMERSQRPDRNDWLDSLSNLGSDSD